jgi:hypothetical protein
MFLKDLIHVADGGLVRLRSKLGEVVAGRQFGDASSVVEVHGWVDLVCRERGKIVPGTRRRSNNIWTNSGREYLSQLMALKTSTVTYRRDAVAYIGVGEGTQLEEPGVLKLDKPIPYEQQTFLADIQQASFPLYPVRTTVRFFRTFTEEEITTDPAVPKVLISELGLYTNGDPNATPEAYAFNSLSRGYSASKDVAPVAYKTFEPVGKTPAMQLDVAWEIRF